MRVVSAADDLDSDDGEATIGIQVRCVFNELQLQDLRKKTLRGQIGPKERGFIVGEATFGYRSVPVGTIRIDKKGRPRPLASGGRWRGQTPTPSAREMSSRGAEGR